jgi:heme/copper-type cytochrome/quinol oxidase subunit 4
VFIPFPTALIVDSNGPAGWATFIYMSSMLFLAIIQLAMKLYVNKHKNLLSSGTLAVRGFIGSQIIVGLLIVAIIIAVIFPNIGLWTLLLLWSTPLFVKPVKKLQRSI